MAPQPEYDKEPKAPDKTVTNNITEDSINLHNVLHDQHINSDIKAANLTATVETEDNKHVEALDDGQLRALLDEAITYKCPKDREGKSSLFKELLEEVEQDEQACEAAARSWAGSGSGSRGGGSRGVRAAGRSRRVLPHSNSLQDLVAALAAEPAPRRRHHHHQVSARTHHGGSLPSGVDTSFLLSDEGRGCGVVGASSGVEYVATVRCENPSPLSERRVSASDAHSPTETDALNRRSKMASFPMTYTARATLEIGSGAVSSGRAVTTTTASNQVRTLSPSTAHSSPLASSTLGEKPRGPENTPTPDLTKSKKIKKRQKQSLMRSCLGEVNAMNVRPQFDVRSSMHHVIEPNTRRYEVPFPTPGPVFPDITKDEDSVQTFHNNNNTNRYDLVFRHAYAPLYGPPERIFTDFNCRAAAMQYNKKPGYESRFYLKSDIQYRSKPKSNCKEISMHTIEERISQNSDLQNKITKYSDTTTDDLDESNSNDTYEFDYGQKVISNTDLVRQTFMREMSRFESPRNVKPMTIGKALVFPPNLNEDCDNNLNDKAITDISTKDKITDKETLITNSDVLSIQGNKINFLQVHDIVSVKLNGEENNTTEFVEQQYSIDNCDTKVDFFVNNETKVTPNESLKQQVYLESQDLNKSTEESEESLSQFIEFNRPAVEDTSIEMEEFAPLKYEDLAKPNNIKYFADQNKLFEALKGLNVAVLDVTICDSKLMEKFRKENTVCDILDAPQDSANIISKSKYVLEPIEEETEEKQNAEFIETVVKTEKDTGFYKVNNEDSLIDKNNSTESNLQSNTLLEVYNAAGFYLDIPNYFLSPSSYKTNSALSLDKKSSSSSPTQAGNSDVEIKVSNEKQEKVSIETLRELMGLPLSDAVPGESRLMTYTANDKVDSGIPFSCITTPEVVASCNTTSSVPQAAIAVDAKPLRVSASSFNGLPLSRPTHYGALTSPTNDEYKKSLDENGNSVQGYGSPLSASSHNKKLRRKKSSKNETVIKSHQIDGYQGNKDLDELLRFIESTEEASKQGKLRPPAKHHHDDDKTKKRSTERRKDKESRVQRATSMEELSRTKLEDLTDTDKPSPPELRRSKKEARAPERRSWGDEARPQRYYYEDAQHKHDKKKPKPSKSVDSAPEPHSDTALDLDFQTVTKKKKQRKRFEETSRKPRAASPDRRRKSAPPSDKSNDSNDDMDSVHSLPGHLSPSATRAAPTAAPAPASYADIARTRHNIPDLIESCNYYAEEVEAGAVPVIDPDSYPALEVRGGHGGAGGARTPTAGGTVAPRGGKVSAPRGKELQTAPPPPATPDPPDLVSDRRPPVILLDEAAQARDMDGITFGFDINEQLLNGESGAGRAHRCDLVREAIPGWGTGGVCVLTGPGCALHYLPPPEPPAGHLHIIVEYVGNAWEDIIKLGGGKVRYFSE